MDNIGYILMQLSKQLRYQLNQRLVANGLTIQQWAVMEQISLWVERTAQQPTANQLCHVLDMDRPTMSGILRRLAAKQLVEQEVNPADQRAKLLRLTEVGTQELQAGQRISDQVVATRLQKLTAPEQRTLRQLLKKLRSDE
ncbi:MULTISPECIES: MarR family winged helix-turn-helix transcriptional regulator [Lactiplantibacillus]|jgi:MarR family transcriptional regulator, lower aerobic nicotinate degradation pathway regulator|uniref:Winged helix-turn-helix transcriptional regulator n=1 Tax=Lactiplantibacillus argentoratensis TaxID=271881 RepID=A0ABS5UKS5_9LACO|nr:MULTISPECIES: MarR family winged helix-turn-helix transcriptional regulator [Lactiplantibacillus]AYC72337.1 MarR family transcriptional regulator [Lactiplantibacillus plantarum]KZU12564.1 putative transcriptional regulator [Lactiplantibacillus plantarum]MBT1139185.1 winged helix-turn-helix transcriptional regulator [Lactiplantibacillus argentoratensis]MBT1142021.1 winged helix-turn-helix transcriptional regulator [Lactiplantibacillus argentoratensis]